MTFKNDKRRLLQKQPVIAVVKKNATLTKLHNMLYDFSEEKRKLNLLMIDDESDHATINTKTTSQGLQLAGYEDYEDEEQDDEITDATKLIQD